MIVHSLGYGVSNESISSKLWTEMGTKTQKCSCNMRRKLKFDTHGERLW